MKIEKRFKWTGIGSISIDPSKINDAIMKQNSAKISKGCKHDGENNIFKMASLLNLVRAYFSTI